jgi:hypothetical protein
MVCDGDHGLGRLHVFEVSCSIITILHKFAPFDLVLLFIGSSSWNLKFCRHFSLPFLIWSCSHVVGKCHHGEWYMEPNVCLARRTTLDSPLYCACGENQRTEIVKSNFSFFVISISTDRILLEKEEFRTLC